MTTRVYYLLQLRPAAPLRLSAGYGTASDNDLARDSRNLPYIPGSSLAGALRALLPEEEANLLFGYLDPMTGTCRESFVMVSDGVFQGDEQDFQVSIRDGVELEDSGVARESHKYDFEVLETVMPFAAVLEVSAEDGMQALTEKVLALAGNDFCLGARTTRGYGRMTLNVRRKLFRFPEDLPCWLDWDPRGEAAWEQAEELSLQKAASADRVEICADLMLSGSFTVRVYAVPDNSDSTADFTYLSPFGCKKEKAVIPGTTWSGVFRHHMRNLCREAGLDETALHAVDAFFGVPRERKGKQVKEDVHRSRIRFGETVVTGGNKLGQQRVAVDRFTAAPRDKALYHTEAYHGGSGCLQISFACREAAEPVLSLLNACLLDLHSGILAFGGETGVGRGRAVITRLTVNGKDVTEALEEQKPPVSGEKVNA